MIFDVTDKLPKAITTLERRTVEDLVFLVANSALIGLGVYLCLDGNPYGYLALATGVAGITIQFYRADRIPKITALFHQSSASSSTSRDKLRYLGLNPDRATIKRRIEKDRGGRRSIRLPQFDPRQVLLFIGRTEKSSVQDVMEVGRRLHGNPVDIFTVELNSPNDFSATDALERRWEEIIDLYIPSPNTYQPRGQLEEDVSSEESESTEALANPGITIVTSIEDAVVGYAMMNGKGWAFDQDGSINHMSSSGKRQYCNRVLTVGDGNLPDEVGRILGRLHLHYDSSFSLNSFDDLTFNLLTKLPDAHPGG